MNNHGDLYLEFELNENKNLQVTGLFIGPVSVKGKVTLCYLARGTSINDVRFFGVIFDPPPP